MKLLMISGDRAVLAGKRGPFWQTLDAMRAHWNRIDVICPRAGVTGEQKVFENVFFHPSPGSLWGQSDWIFRTGGQLHALEGHDVMTVHEYPPFYNGMGALKLHRRIGIPAVAEIHHIVGHPVPASFTERIGAFLSRWYLPRELRAFSAVRTVNAQVRDTLASWGVPADRIRVVPSFYLDASVLGPKPDAAKAYDLVFAARLVPNKGLLELLTAVSTLPGIRLLVVGDGPLLATAKDRAARLGILDRVTFAGWLETPAQLADAMRSGRAFVMNSSSEGGPRVLLEALACGIPVVSTRVGIAVDAVRDGQNGVFTDGSPTDLARGIQRILTPSIAETALREAPEVLKRHERTAAIKAYAEFLKDIAAVRLHY